MSEAGSILEECLSTDVGSLLCIRVNSSLCTIKALQRLTGQERIGECVDLAAQLRLLVHLRMIRTCVSLWGNTSGK